VSKKLNVRTTLLMIVLYVLGMNINAQKLRTTSKKAISLYNQASGFYGSSQFQKAIEPLLQAIEKDPNFINAYLLLSEVYFEQKDFENQAVYLEKSLALDSTFYTYGYYNLGVAYYNLDRFDESVKWFKKYYTKTNKEEKKADVVNWLNKVYFTKKAKENPVNIEAKNLGPKVNSQFNEYWPSVTADDKILVYTVLVARDAIIARTPFTPSLANNFHEDFYRSIKDNNGEWGERRALSSPINSDSNEGAQTLSADGNWMFFTACGRRDTRGSCDIYFSRRTETGWSEPKNIGPLVNTPYWESQPSFSSDGVTLYFASNRGGGQGKNDIWRAKIIGYMSDGTPFFSKPENLGPKVNTPGNESSPFIHHDNQTLYFSSEGWPGIGEMDVFLNKMDATGNFTESVNLGYPINSSGDDVGLILTSDGEKAYFSSERMGKTFGGKDLFSFKMPPQFRPEHVSYVKGRVFDIKTNERLKAAFELKDLDTKKMVVQTTSTDFSGEFLICLPAGGSYALNVSREGYLFYSDHFEMKEKSSVIDPMIMDIYLKPIKVGEQIVLNNVFFETDSYVLKEISTLELDKVVSFLTLNETVKIELIGYTDNVGAEAYNINLSKKRAEQVYNYLIEAGINSTRLKFSGKGMSDPIESNETEQGRAKNRRTELKIIE